MLWVQMICSILQETHTWAKTDFHLSKFHQIFSVQFLKVAIVNSDGCDFWMLKMASCLEGMKSNIVYKGLKVIPI